MGKLVKDFPEEKEVIICTVKKILRDSIFVELDDYAGKEGMIHISEIAPGRIRNIRDYVKENKKIVCIVLRLRADKGHIDLSLRRVTASMKVKKNEETKQEVKAEKILEIVGKNLKYDLNKMYDIAGNKILENYDLLHPCFQEIVLADASILTDIGIEKKIADEITKVVKEKIKPPEVKVEYILTLSSEDSNGIDIIKNTLKDTENFAKKNKYNLNILYLGAPRYKLTLKSPDYKTAEKEAETLGEVAITSIKKSGGKGNLEKGK